MVRVTYKVPPRVPKKKIWVPKTLKVQSMGFNDIPPEIRNDIYHLAFVSLRARLVRWDRGYQILNAQDYAIKAPGFPTGLLIASRAIYAEAAPVFYGGNRLHYSEKSINHFFDPIPNLQTGAPQLRTTTKYLRHIRVADFENMLSKYHLAAVDLRCITEPIINATKAAIRNGEKMALERLEVRRLRWRMASILPGLHAMLRELRKLKSEKSLEESGVLDIVHFVAYDRLGSLTPKKAEDAGRYTERIRAKLKVLIEKDEGVSEKQKKSSGKARKSDELVLDDD